MDYLETAKEMVDGILENEANNGSYPTAKRDFDLRSAQVYADIALAEEVRRLRELLLKHLRGGRLG